MGCVSETTSFPLPTADPDTAARLRDALLAASFTADGLLDLLGAPRVRRARPQRDRTRAAGDPRGHPLETLVRLFLLQQPVPYARVADVLPADACLEAGWLRRTGGRRGRRHRGRTAVRRTRRRGLVHRLRPRLRRRRGGRHRQP
ncbi:hypothetical protein GCM10020256_33400 [Streptomyces thermocoprophilus]